LQVLEGVGERGQLAGCVRMCMEELAPVERAHAHECVLEARGSAAESVETLLDQFGMAPCLLEMRLEQLPKRRALRQRHGALEELLGVLLDRVSVGEVLAELLVQIVAADSPQ